MKALFLTLVFLHGLIHIMGFLKAFKLSRIEQLTMPISKSYGVLWLLAFLLFCVYGLLILLENKYAWIPGLTSVLISQLLIFLFWKDAKFGTMPNVVILSIVLVGLGSFLIRQEFTRAVKQDFLNNNDLPLEILSESDLAHLPPPVKKYLSYTKSIGQPKVKNFRAEFTGKMRSAIGDDFMNLKSVQYNFYRVPSRYFYMTAKKGGLPATGLHKFMDETAIFQVKLLNWIKVVDAKGNKLNQAETVTLLNDMCFIAPATLIDQRISWEEIDDKTVRAVFKNGEITVSAKLYFNEAGALVNFISQDRFHTDGKTYINYPWETPVEDYRSMHGYLLPGSAKLIYQIPEGIFIYGELEFKDVTYNVSAFTD